MMTLGEKIKDLRKKNNLTQEKMAEYLNVSYQAISKWECGITSPDLAMLVPLTRLFHVSADELLGLNEEKVDERKAYFDAEYRNFWLTDDPKEEYKTASQAVAEYPGEFKYLSWLARTEFYVANNHKKESPELFREYMESSLKHYMMILEDCEDEKLRRSTIYDIVNDYRCLKMYDEAKKYAEMLPESIGMTRDDALLQCLHGDELLRHRQKMIRNSLGRLANNLFGLWLFGDIEDDRTRVALETEEKIIRAVITDDNFNGFNAMMYMICFKQAEIALHDGDHAKAVEKLWKAKKHGVEYDRVKAQGKGEYTCLMLDKYADDYSDPLPYMPHADLWLERIKTMSVFDPLREREDFKKMIEEC